MGESKILITGTFSGGTTYTVALLTLLGHDTGYTAAEALDCFGGMEWMYGHKARRRKIRKDLREGDDYSPKIIKHPFEKKIVHDPTPQVLYWAKEYDWDVERVILLVRDLEEVKDRRKGFNVEPHAIQMTNILKAVSENNWPLNIVSFPRAAVDPEYCYRALAPLSGDKYHRFKQVWQRHRRLDKIHAGI